MSTGIMAIEKQDSIAVNISKNSTKKIQRKMGNKNSGNRSQFPTRGKGKRAPGGGRKSKDPQDKRTINKLMSPRLWDLLNIRTMEACEEDWHVFLEKVLEGRVTIACSRQAGARRADVV